MFSLFKLVFDAAAALFLFYSGMKVQQNYPNLLTNLAGAWTWIKGLLTKV